MKSLLFVLLMASAFGQSPAPSAKSQTCPITGIQFWSAPGNFVAVKTDKTEGEVVSVEWQIHWLDSFGHNTTRLDEVVDVPHYIYQVLRRRGISDRMSVTAAPSSFGWLAVKAVRFKDGSVWEDNGSLSCRGYDAVTLKHMAAGQPVS